MKYTPLLNSEVSRYTGNLPLSVIKTYGKKYLVDAFKTFDPKKGAALSTHLVHNLKRLNRVNYASSSMFRLSEELQQGVGQLKHALDDLRNRLGREPSIQELAQELLWSESKVARTMGQIKSEAALDGMEVEPAYAKMGDPKVDYFYHDLSPEDQVIFELKTGYLGVPVVKNKDIAKKLKKSTSYVSQSSKDIAMRFNKIIGAEK
jgi:DNA-directed RNA polymerase specialized sigma subunit